MPLALTDLQAIDVGGLVRYRIPGGTISYTKADAQDLIYVHNYRGASVLTELPSPGFLAKTLKDAAAAGVIFSVDATDPLACALTPVPIAANVNNYAPAGMTTATKILRLAATAARSITGLTGGQGTRLLELWNVGTFAITLVANSSSSLAGNRFLVAANVVLAANGGGAMLRYDPVGLGWRASGKS